MTIFKIFIIFYFCHGIFKLTWVIRYDLNQLDSLLRSALTNYTRTFYFGYIVVNPGPSVHPSVRHVLLSQTDRKSYEQANWYLGVWFLVSYCFVKNVKKFAGSPEGQTLGKIFFFLQKPGSLNSSYIFNRRIIILRNMFLVVLLMCNKDLEILISSRASFSGWNDVFLNLRLVSKHHHFLHWPMFY